MPTLTGSSQPDCTMYSLGACQRQDDCPHAHDRRRARVCLMFNTEDGCPNGELCQFRHDDIQVMAYDQSRPGSPRGSDSGYSTPESQGNVPAPNELRDALSGVLQGGGSGGGSGGGGGGSGRPDRPQAPPPSQQDFKRHLTLLMQQAPQQESQGFRSNNGGNSNSNASSPSMSPTVSKGFKKRGGSVTTRTSGSMGSGFKKKETTVKVRPPVHTGYQKGDSGTFSRSDLDINEIFELHIMIAGTSDALFPFRAGSGTAKVQRYIDKLLRKPQAAHLRGQSLLVTDAYGVTVNTNKRIMDLEPGGGRQLSVAADECPFDF